MKRKRFTEEQVISILIEREAGISRCRLTRVSSVFVSLLSGLIVEQIQLVRRHVVLRSVLGIEKCFV